ncbi:MAG: hypothetical protein ABIO36_02420 [Pyrinomonadaceae bacterium]
MKTRFFVSAAIAVLVLNIVGLSAADIRRSKVAKRQATRLVTLLPASDGVAVFDSKRFLDEALPKVLSANQPMLGEIMAKIKEMETRTGVDLRKFDQVAVGVAYKQVSAKETDFEPVAIASGDINAGALIAVAKLASNGTYREEKIGDRTVYIFSAKDVTHKTAAKNSNSKIAGYLDKAIQGLSKEIAITALDKNTLVIGVIGRVRETLAGQTRIAADISSLLSVKETAVMSFALKPPGGMSHLLPLDNDELGKNIDSIQYLSGSLDVAAIGTSLQMSARTKMAEQAVGLKDTIEGLQVLGAMFFGGSKRADQQVYGRMIKNAKIVARGSDVTLDLLVPQADIDVLIAGVK